MDNVWKIRLLGGVLHGREVWLSDGKLSVGERGCDLCLPLNEEGTMLLSVKEKLLFIDAGDAPVWVNGRKHRTHNPLPREGVLQTCGVTMAFGMQEANLAGYLPPTGTPFAFWGITLVLLVLIALALRLLWNTEPAHPSQDVPTRVDTLLHQMVLDEVHAHWNQDGTLQLSGTCQNEKALLPLHQRLQSWGVLYHDSIVCSDQLVRSVQDVLVQAGYAHAVVVRKGEGEVEIQADITMGERWAAVQPMLAEVPGLTHWKVKNAVDEQGDFIIAALIRSGLESALNMTVVGQSFVISGVLGSKEKQTLMQLMLDIRARYPGIALSYQDMPASTEFADRLPSPVTGIVHSPRGDYLVLANGTHLTVGSRLPDGSEVVALNEGSVAFRQGRTLFNYAFNF